MAKWTPDEDAELRRLHGQGLYDSEIAMRMPGRTAASINQRRITIGLKSHGTNAPAPPDVLDRIRALAKDGHSAAEIGRTTGRSRNSVIGLCSRHGIALGNRKVDGLRKGWGKKAARKPSKKPEGWVNPSQLSRAERERRANEAMARAEERSKEVAERIGAANEGALRLPMVSVERKESQIRRRKKMPHYYEVRGLRVDQCRFALTEAGPHEFCAKPAVAGSSWCPDHYGICVQGTLSPRSLLKAMGGRA